MCKLCYHTFYLDYCKYSEGGSGCALLQKNAFPDTHYFPLHFVGASFYSGNFKVIFYYLFVRFLSIHGFAPQMHTFMNYQRKNNLKPHEILLQVG